MGSAFVVPGLCIHGCRHTVLPAGHSRGTEGPPVMMTSWLQQCRGATQASDQLDVPLEGGIILGPFCTESQMGVDLRVISQMLPLAQPFHGQALQCPQ